MAMENNRSSSSPNSRPTLPSLRSLNLPVPDLRERFESMRVNDTNDFHDYTTRTHPRFRTHNRQTSVSSSVTASSRSSASPSPSDPPVPTGLATTATTRLPSLSISNAPGYRLILSTLETADAIVVLSPTLHDQPLLPSSATSSSATPPWRGKALLLVGPAMQQYLRNNERNISRGARVHPYRIVKVDPSKRSKGPSKNL